MIITSKEKRNFFNLGSVYVLVDLLGVTRSTHCIEPLEGEEEKKRKGKKKKHFYPAIHSQAKKKKAHKRKKREYGNL